MYRPIKHPHLTIFILAISALFFACEEEEKQIPPPEIFLANQEAEIEINMGDTIILEPKVTYNIDGQYQWKKNGELLLNNTQYLLDTATQLGRIEYSFSVLTPYGSDSMTIPVDVIVLADFTNMFPDNFKNDSSWIGSLDSEGFSYRDLFFSTHLNADSSWVGFGLSNIQSKSGTEEDIPENSVYNNASNNVFSVVRHPHGTHQPIPAIIFEDGKNHRLKSIEINNTAMAAFQLKKGNDDFPRMGYPSDTDPDWFKVTITGIDASGSITGNQDFYLADYRFDNNKRDYIVTSWTEVDLSGLGEVNQLQFSLSSSKTNEEGEMITPQMFCIDNLKILN